MAKTEPHPPSRKWLYGPFILFGVLIAAYTAYWFGLRQFVLAPGIDGWIAEQRAAGATVEYKTKRLHGFPYRFALTVDAPHYVDPASGTDWRGETLQIVMQPWNFNHAIIRSSGRNELASRNSQPLTALIGNKSALSLTWDDNGLKRTGLSLDTADITLLQGTIRVRGLTANLLPIPDADFGNRLAVDWDGVTLDEALITGTDAAALGTELQAARLRLEGHGFGLFGEAPDRKADLAQFLFNWGPLQIGAKGKFDITPAGHLDGTLHVRLEDIDRLREALDTAGLLGPQVALILGLIGSGSQNGNFVPIPIRNGAITYFGQSLATLPPIAPPRATADPA